MRSVGANNVQPGRPLTGPRPHHGGHQREQSAAEAKATAMARAFAGRGAGQAASLEERMLDGVTGVVAQVPGLKNAPVIVKQAGRYGGPFFATLAFVFGGVETAAHWKRLDRTERALGVATTAVSGLAAFASIAALSVPAFPLASVGILAGMAGSLFAVSALHQAMHDPKVGPGERGLTATALLFSLAGTALACTPFAGTGVLLMLAGGNANILAGFLGKKPAVERAFRRLGF